VCTVGVEANLTIEHN